MGYDFKEIKVLVVEDNQPMLKLVTSILKTFGVQNVETAMNGAEGFKKFCKNNHDIIIADWMMNPVGGIELTRMLRSDSASPNKYVPVIIMTGFGDKERVMKARDSGATEFLVKPFNTRDLYSRLVLALNKPRQFVRSNTFFGPDRRRKRTDNFDGEYKRATDVLFGKAIPHALLKVYEDRRSY